LAAAGMGTGRVLRPIALLSFGIAALVAWLSLVVSPWAVEQGMQLREQAEAQSELSSISAGQFREIGTDHSVFYVESLSADKKLMNHVFVRNSTPSGDDLFAANNGYQYTDPQTGDGFLVLLDGRRYEGNPGAEHFRIHEFAKASVRMDPKEVRPHARKRDAQSTSALFNSEDINDAAELQWRLSMPISAMLLGLLAVLVSRTSPREGRYARLFGAILIYIIYNNLMGVAQNWLQRGKVSPALGMWWVHVLLIIVIAGLLAHQYGWRYLSARRIHGQAT
jgi:lipopolysaccharide export system permease protein